MKGIKITFNYVCCLLEMVNLRKVPINGKEALILMTAIWDIAPCNLADVN
jgi:hypothetical protein